MDVPTYYHERNPGHGFECPECGAAVDNDATHTDWHKKLAELAAAVDALQGERSAPRCVSCGGDLTRQGNAWRHLGTPGCDFLIVPEHLQ